MEHLLDGNKVHTKINAGDLLQFADRKNNVRDPKLGYDVEGFGRTLANDGSVFEEVHICVGSKTNAKDFLAKLEKSKDILPLLREHEALVTKGFRRCAASAAVTEDVDAHKFARGDKGWDPNVPVVILFGMTKAEQLRYKLDHSQNRTLNPYELGLVIQQEKASGLVRTNIEIVWDHLELFLAAMTAGKQQEYANKVLAHVELSDKISDRKARMKTAFDFCKGRYQFLQRTFCGPNSDVLMENYRKKVFGIKTKGIIVNLNGDRLITIASAAYNDRDKFLAKFEEYKQATIDARAKDAIPDRRWKKADFIEKLPTFNISETMKTILTGVGLGDEECLKQFTELRDWLVKVETAQHKDPNTFNTMVDEMAK